jgi:hypothetical protein
VAIGPTDKFWSSSAGVGRHANAGTVAIEGAFAADVKSKVRTPRSTMKFEKPVVES